MKTLINHICKYDTEMSADGLKGIRNCHALTVEEDIALRTVIDEAELLFALNGVPEDAYEIKSDAIGNLFITLFGENRAETVMSGSHIDSVKDGGIYDGLAGVCSAFEYLKRLLSKKITPKRNYCVAVFRAEESSPRTGVACLGSRIATGTITKNELNAIQYTLDDGSKIHLEDYMYMNYGTDAWENILAEIDNPPIKSGEVVAYEEIHIEQSSVLERNGVMAGILIDGIGGAVREKAGLVLPDLFKNEVVQEGTEFALQVFGEPAHTGGTPPNLRLKKKYLREDEVCYRTDALMVASYLTRMILRYAKNNDGVYLTHFYSPDETGYTTVPFRQDIGITVTEEASHKFEPFMEKCINRTMRNFGVDIEGEGHLIENKQITYLNTRVADKLLQIPLASERYARDAVLRQGGLGKVRMTVTDFGVRKNEDEMQDEGTGRVDFKVDFRDVDSAEVSDLISIFHDKVSDVTRSVFAGGKMETVAVKKFSAVKNGGPIIIKQSYANIHGIKTLEMPSLPGHDAGILAGAGVPVSMTFVAHDGKSHCPDEFAPAENMEKAMQISHDFLSVKLGVNL